MKIKLLPALLALLALAGFSGCASVGSSNTKDLLTASGFRMRTPETPKQKELYAAAESYKVLRISLKDKVLYAYKDEKNGTAFVGDEAAYQQYRRLAIQQNIAEQQVMAAQMQREAANGWYGAYGPGYYGPAFVPIGRYR